MTQDGEHKIKFTDDVLCNYAPEPYIVLLTNGTSINSIIFLKRCTNSPTVCKYGSFIASCFPGGNLCFSNRVFISPFGIGGSLFHTINS